MAGIEGPFSVDAFSSRKADLLGEVMEVQKELQSARDDIRNKTGICERILSEIVDIGPKFTEFHGIFMDGDPDWLAELQRLEEFRNIQDDERSLNGVVDRYNTNVTNLLNRLKGAATTAGNKLQALKQLLSEIINASTLSQLEDIHLDSCRWEPTSPLPNLEMVEDDWREDNVAVVIQALIDELQEIVNRHPGIVQAQIDYTAGSSSSSSDYDLQGGMSRMYV